MVLSESTIEKQGSEAGKEKNYEHSFLSCFVIMGHCDSRHCKTQAGSPGGVLRGKGRLRPAVRVGCQAVMGTGGTPPPDEGSKK